MAVPSVADIIKLVKAGATIEAQEKIIELRQAVMTLQEEVLDLRERLQAAEGRLRTVTEPQLPRCPRCGKPAWSLKSSKPDMTFGDLGGVRRTYECKDCGLNEEVLETAK